ncbi:hypothetical protein A9Q99_17695 [Gammaproteobacteria bacterium 45_16_T64]|nr:hypothetical protein A9Q99_17695 [Gammaproteobacteria bacterium 45_16_T64]
MLGFIFLLFIVSPIIGKAEAGETIKLGMSTALSGPSRDLGQSMSLGVKTYIDRVNRAGGVNQRKIELIIMDDGYQANAALKNAKKLLDQGVVAMIGNVGTPTAKLTEPFSNKHKIVFFAPYSGANLLRDYSVSPFTFNFRASYSEEMEVIIGRIFEQGVEPRRVSFFIQDDAYGNAGLAAANDALVKRGFNNISDLEVFRYSRNTNDVSQALKALLKMKIKPLAIILVGTYGPSSKFINYSSTLLPNTLFFNLSFVGAHTLSKNLDVNSNKIFITQVVPSIGSDITATKELREQLAKRNKSSMYNSITLEGYVAAKILVNALEKMKGEVDGVRLRNSLESGAVFDVGLGHSMMFTPEEHQASHKVWLLQYDRKNQFIDIDGGNR